MCKPASSLTGAMVLCLVGFSAPAAEAQKEPQKEPRKETRKETRRETKWNNPDGPKTPGIEHGSFRSPSMDVEVG